MLECGYNSISNFNMIGEGDTTVSLNALFPDLDKRVSKECESIFQRKFKLLKSDLFHYPKNILWDIDPLTRSRWWIIRNRPCIFSLHEDKDIRYVWELNRHQHLLSLGKAYVLSRDMKYAQEICDEIMHWIKYVKKGKSVNWISGLEISIRIISWLWAINWLSPGNYFNNQQGEKIRLSIYEQTKYIYKHLQKREFPNNHLIGEAVGLVIVGILFPAFKEAEEWKNNGLKILEEQMVKQVFDEGMDKEQAFDYHRFVVDFYTLVLILCRKYNVPTSKTMWDKLEKMYEVLLYALRPDRAYPMIGDDDNGRVIKLSEDISKFAVAALSTGAVLFKRGDMKWISGGFQEESFWLLGMDGYKEFESLPSFPPSKTSYFFSDAEQYIMRSGWGKGDLYLYFDSGMQGLGDAGHGHADALSFELFAYGNPLIIDSGTYSYNGSQKWRNYFRGTSAHNTIVIDGVDQAEPLKPYDQFGWAKKADGHSLNWYSLNNFDFASGYHDGYQRLQEPVIHQRDVLFVKPEYWIVSDFLKGNGEHELDLLFHLPPGKVTLENDSKSLKTCNSSKQGNILILPADKNFMQVQVLQGKMNPIQGWVSYNYGDKIEAPVLKYSKQSKLPAGFFTILYPYKNGQVPSITVDSVNICDSFARSVSLPLSKCLEIKIDKVKDYYFICPKNNAVKYFSNFKTDAELVCLRENDDTLISSCVIQNGTFLSRQDEMFISLNKPVHYVEIVRRDARVDIIISEFVPIKVYIRNIKLLTINGIEKEIKYLQEYCFVTN